MLARALDDAVGKFLENQRSPSRKVHELDNRGSTFYLALYWAEALAAQSDDADLQAKFKGVAADLGGSESKIIEELIGAQGGAVDLGGYYHIDDDKASKAMQPSGTLQGIIAAL